MLYTKEWIQAIVRETLKEIPVCREGTGTSEGSKVSFHTAHADVVPFPPLEGETDSDFGFGPDVDPEIGIYDMDTISFLQA